MENPLKKFFEPSSIAIVGASAKPGKVGNELLKNIMKGYKGKIFPINPRASEIMGLKAYHSILEVPEDIDLVIVAIPSEFIQKIIEQCAQKKVRAALIVSGGFSEAGEHGKKLEKTLVETARKAHIRIIGPNCQGISSPSSGLCATWAGFSTLSGPIAIITQSGSVGGAIQLWAQNDCIGISKCINLGNKVDVNESELLEFLKSDVDTKVIVLYLEGVTNGRALMSIASEVSKIKPIVVLKGGTTKAGRKAMLSHTSSLAGRKEVFEAAMKKAGVIRADTLEELYDIAKAFALLPLPRGPGVLIIETTGGFGILAADTCERLGLMLPEPSGLVKRKLRKVLPEFCIFSNPFDLTAAGVEDPNSFKMVIEENMNNDEFHAFMPIFGDPVKDAAEAIRKAVEVTNKPIVVVYAGGGEIEKIEKAKMQSMGIPVFPSAERAVVALHALLTYSRVLRRQTLHKHS